MVVTAEIILFQLQLPEVEVECKLQQLAAKSEFTL
jgi:hypothetical protein